MKDTKGNYDPAFYKEYYGNNRSKKPNNHCEWIDDGTILPGWYETNFQYQTRLTRNRRKS